MSGVSMGESGIIMLSPAHQTDPVWGMCESISNVWNPLLQTLLLAHLFFPSPLNMLLTLILLISNENSPKINIQCWGILMKCRGAQIRRSYPWNVTFLAWTRLEAVVSFSGNTWKGAFLEKMTMLPGDDDSIGEMLSCTSGSTVLTGEPLRTQRGLIVMLNCDSAELGSTTSTSWDSWLYFFCGVSLLRLLWLLTQDSPSNLAILNLSCSTSILTVEDVWVA